MNIKALALFNSITCIVVAIGKILLKKDWGGWANAALGWFLLSINL